MTAAAKPELTYQILHTLTARGVSTQPVDITLTQADFEGGSITQAEVVTQLGELVEAQYLTATVSTDPAGAFEVKLQQVAMTNQGITALGNLKRSLGLNVQAPETLSFLEKVMNQAGLDDLYDARDIAEVIFRTMRDVMPNEVADRVAAELNVQVYPTDDRALGKMLAELWRDTNPFVAFLSRIRSPLDIKDETFIFRVQQEGGLQRGISPEAVTSAVFTAIKAELSAERIQEIQQYMPGDIKQMWSRA